MVFAREKRSCFEHSLHACTVVTKVTQTHKFWGGVKGCVELFRKFIGFGEGRLPNSTVNITMLLFIYP